MTWCDALVVSPGAADDVLAVPVALVTFICISSVEQPRREDWSQRRTRSLFRLETTPEFVSGPRNNASHPPARPLRLDLRASARSRMQQATRHYAADKVRAPLECPSGSSACVER